jgi:Glycosyltransferase GT-D fold
MREISVDKVIGFIKKYLLVDPMFVFRYAIAYFQRDYDINVQVQQKNQTVELILSGKSFIRLGDGEVALIKMIDVHFQKANQQIKDVFKNIIKQYSASSPYILAIPVRYITQSNSNLASISLLRCWLPFKIAYRQFFSKDIAYADAHAFYVSGFFEENLTEYLKTKKLLLVAKKIDNEAFKKNTKVIYSNVEYIDSPSEQAFEEYSNIQNKIDAILATGDKKDIVILAAIGPTSKVLAYDYSKLGVQVLDIGHGMEHLYTGKALDHVLI